MDQASIQTAVTAFQAARTSTSTIEALPDSAAPQTMADGYAIQEACIQAWGKNVVGWKVGATNQAALDLFGIDEPFLGPIFDGTVHESPSQLASANFQHYCVESEFAFRLGTDLPARDSDYSHDELRAAVAEVIPAFELISPRFSGIPKGNGPAATADCGIGAGIILGKPHKGLDNLDLISHPVTLTVGGKMIAEGTGGLVMGDPINALQWTARKLASLGKSLHAGDLVTTGTCTGVQFVEAGKTCVADFGTLGTVETIFN